MNQTDQKEPVSVFMCGGSLCKDGKDHEWDGPIRRWKTGSSQTCSKCGMTRMDFDMWNCP